MLTWQQTEFLLKGVYLGLLVTIAWRVPRWDELAYIGLFTLAGLALFVGVAAVRKIREGYRVRGRWLGFLIFLILENPGMVYAGLVLGLTLGAWETFKLTRPDDEVPFEAVLPILGGAALGGVFYGLRHVRMPLYRFWIGLAMVTLLIGGAVALFYFKPELLQESQRQMIGTLLLLGLPGFYLLTFSGLVEESEIEIAAMCAALGIGFATYLSALSPAMSGAAVLLPIGLFFVYTTRVMPGLRVFKHALRGMSYRQMGQTRLALISLGRALQLDPQHALARHQLWDLHRDLDFAELKREPELIPLLNFEFCLDRISQLLQTRPGPDDLRESLRMLDLITLEQPQLQPICAYWRAVALLHEHRHAEAAGHLTGLLKLPQMQTPERQAIHFPAWLLAMQGHPEMVRRVGQVLLPGPGQHMDAIAAVETQLALTPSDASAWDMKRQLYSELTEREYHTGTGAGPGADKPTAFNHEYIQQLGLALLDNPQQWQRGCEYLRIAAHGLPLQAVNLYFQIAQAHEKHGDPAGMWANYQRAMQLGRADGGAGAQNLPPPERASLFATVKKVGEQALAQNRLDTALEAFKFYSQNENAGLETYRTLAELFERKSDVWQALHCTEHALSYNASDADLLARKDRYYYSIMPEDLKGRLENVRKWFDPFYCMDKAEGVLKNYQGNLEMLDWAAHLAELAHIALPGSHAARLLQARVRRLRGEIPETLAVLEEIRQHRPEKFANEKEEEGWYFAHRMLGDLTLDTQPELAAVCFEEFRQSDHSGADTLYKLGRAYEALGKFKQAAECYESVTAYERHPLYHEAREALDRLKRAAPAPRS